MPRHNTDLMIVSAQRGIDSHLLYCGWEVAATFGSDGKQNWGGQLLMQVHLLVSLTV